MRKIMIAFLALWPSLAIAADLPPVLTKAPPRQRILVSYAGTGIYWGAHTFAQTNRIDAASPVGSTLGGTFAVGAAVGGTFGWMRGDGTNWQAIEAMASYKNISGSVVTTSGIPAALDSRWSFTERVKLGGDSVMAAINAVLPNMSTVFPTLPPLPPGATGGHPYVFAALHEDDISANFGLDAARAWRVKGGLGLGMMAQLGKGSLNPTGAPLTADVWVELIPSGAGLNVGIPTGVAKVSTGREVRIGAGFYF